MNLANSAARPDVSGSAHVEPVIELPRLRPAVIQATRLFAEAVVVPTLLLALLLDVVGLPYALAAASGWCAAVLAVRWLLERRIPGALVLSTALILARGSVALATSSALIYLLQPAVGSALMAVIFLGSALLGRPLTERLARDFVQVPAHVLDRRGVRRMFRQVAVVWGAAQLLDAGMSIGSLHFGLGAGLLSRAVLSPALTVVTIGVCVALGVRALRRDGVRLVFPAAA